MLTSSRGGVSAHEILGGLAQAGQQFADGQGMVRTQGIEHPLLAEKGAGGIEPVGQAVADGHELVARGEGDRAARERLEAFQADDGAAQG